MNIIGKLKDLFQSDPAFDPGVQPEETAGAEPGVQPVAEAEEPAPDVEPEMRKPRAVMKKEKPARQENYLQNKHVALSLIIDHLSPYSYTKDSSLAVLCLWVIAPENDSQVAWADAAFVNELKTRLHQEALDAVKEIKVQTLTMAEFRDIRKQDPAIKAMDEGRLYYKTHAKSAAGPAPMRRAAAAWLVGIAGQEHLRQPVVKLDSKEKAVWHIGRMEHPTILETNDIIINDDCRSISRQHAAIVLDDGNYYLKCKVGGCRERGGILTKIIRANGKEEELRLLSHRGLACLGEGDVVQLSKGEGVVYLRFTFIDPEA